MYGPWVGRLEKERTGGQPHKAEGRGDQKNREGSGARLKANLENGRLHSGGRPGVGSRDKSPRSLVKEGRQTHFQEPPKRKTGPVGRS